MSSSSRRKPTRTRKRAAEPTPDEMRAFRLAGLKQLARPGGIITVEGEPIPLLTPLDRADDPRGPGAFDSAVIARGVDRFLRPRHEKDWPDGAIPEAVRHTLVTGIAPGFRHRRPLRVVFDDELN